MDISRECVETYLGKYNISLFFYKDTEEEKYKIELYTSYERIPFGFIEYSFDDKNTMNINSLEINERKPSTSTQLTKILLLYILSIHISIIKKVVLNANPGWGESIGKGKEFCLLCFYQKLGFEPVTRIINDIDFDSLEKECNYSSKYILPQTCILCECHKNKKFIFKNFRSLQVEMTALLPNLENALRESYERICRSH